MAESVWMMVTFQIKLCGQIIKITAKYESTREFTRDYLCEGEPVFTVSISQSDIDFEREKSAREDSLEGIPTRHFSDAYLETLAVYRKIVEQLLDHDILLFHGSAIAMDGVAYLFTAKSGTGKSTHTRLWKQVFGERVWMVNDDKPLLHVSEEGVYIYGTPWDGKHHLSTNASAPLKAICILQRGESNSICAISTKEALPMMLQQTHRPTSAQAMGTYLSLLDRLMQKVPVYRLQCNMDPDAARVAFQGMCGE